MDLILTNWALDSYQELRRRHIFSKEEFWEVIRPDVLLLKDGYPSPHEKFKQSKFWGTATFNGNAIQNGFKMNLKRIYICNGYVKNDKSDLREMVKLKSKIDKIKEGKFVQLGVL